MQSRRLKSIPGSIIAPQGFLTGALFCDIKRMGTGKGSNKGLKKDLALIVSSVPATVAGMFTTNQVCAAPVKVCVPRVKEGVAQAIVVNSGNANACTGRQGMKDALEMTACTAGLLQMPVEHVLVASTGRIGLNLPMPNVRKGIKQVLSLLGDSPAHAADTAEAIMTSDTKAKQVAVEFTIFGKKVRVGGICKGAGMIQPGMSPDGNRPATAPQGLHATMLSFITTDAAVDAPTLQGCLQHAVSRSFNRITVDGDMSTNDTVLVLANGLSNIPVLKTSKSPEMQKALKTFQEALDFVALTLAQMIVRDGEGVSHFVTVRVSGAKTDLEADGAARAVANSALVKTSWHGGDPNWGRIIDALGYGPAKIVEEKVDIGYSAPDRKKIVWSLRRGQPTSTSFKTLCQCVAPREFDLHIRLNLGKGSAIMYAADLTEEYVAFNKGDVTDPASLGG